MPSVGAVESDLVLHRSFDVLALRHIVAIWAACCRLMSGVSLRLRGRTGVKNRPPARTFLVVFFTQSKHISPHIIALCRNKLWKSTPAWLPITVVLFIVPRMR